MRSPTVSSHGDRTEIARRSRGDRVEIAWRSRRTGAAADRAPCWRWLAWLVVTVRAPTWLGVGVGVGVGVGLAGRACCRGAAELGAR